MYRPWTRPRSDLSEHHAPGQPQTYPEVPSFFKHTTVKYLTTAPNPEDEEEVWIHNFITLLLLVTNLLLEINNIAVQVDIFAIVVILDKEIARYEIVADELWLPANKGKVWTKKKGVSEETK